MASNSKDYTDFAKMMSSLISGLYFVAGFTFTAITLLITRLPDPTSIFSQVILFLLNVLLNLAIFLAAWFTMHLTILSMNVPPVTRGWSIASILVYTVVGLVTIVTTLLFLMFGMVYLGLASSIAWIAVIAAAYLFIWKPTKKKVLETYHESKN